MRISKDRGKDKPKISDETESTSRNQFNFKNYDHCEVEESNFVLQRNIFKSFPIVKLRMPHSCSNSSSIFNRAKLINKETVLLSKSLSNCPEEVEKEARARFQVLKSFYLLYEVQRFKGKNIIQFEDDLKTSIESHHISIARIVGYSTVNRFEDKDKEDEDEDKKDKGKEGLFLLTERPVNGSLYSFYNFLSKFNYDSSPSSRSKKKTIFSEPYNNEGISLTAKEKYIIIIGICAGVEFIHKLGFVHSKLNPSTIYLNEKLQAIICNYEFIRPEEKNIFNPSTKVNYPSFISPELYEDNIATQKSDVFSLGMLIYYITTGKFLFENQNQISILRKIKNDDFQFKNSICNEYCEIIKRCCSYNQNDRPDISELLSMVLDSQKIYLSSVDPDDNSKFTEAQLEYINSIRSYSDYLKSSKEEEDVKDFNIFDLIDLKDIKPSDINIFQQCNYGDVKSLKKVGYYFYNGENGIVQDDVFALAVFKRAADLNNRKSTKMAAYLTYKKANTKSQLNEAKSLYERALELYKGKDTECKEIKRKLEEIQLKIDHFHDSKFAKEHNDDIDDDSLEERKKIIEAASPTEDGSESKIFFTRVPNNASKSDIKDILSGYSIKKVNIRHLNYTNAASIIFSSPSDKSQFLGHYRKNKEMFNKQQFILEESKKQKRVRFKKLYKKRTPLGFVPIKYITVIFQPVPSNRPRSQISFKDYYPGEGNKEYIKVGSGNFSDVYKIYSKKSKQIYAAKVLKNELLELFERRNFRREINALTEMNHPLIIRLYGCELSSLIDPLKDAPTLIIEYATNRSLSDAIENKPDWWNSTTKLKAMIAITKAMAFVHEKGYIHRDLKPDNIFFDEKYEIKIGDFGCSRKDDVDKTNQVGTPIYMAPEVIDEYYSFEADVYPFAFIMLEILKGTKVVPPTRGAIKFFEKYLKKGWRPEIPSNLDINLKKLIEITWSNQINDRPLYYELFGFFKSVCEDPSIECPFFNDVDIIEIRNYLKELEKIIC